MTTMTHTERCRLSESCLPDAEYRTRLTALHDDMLAEIEAAHAVGIRQEQELMECEALLRQCLKAFEEVALWESAGDPEHPASKAITAIRARLSTGDSASPVGNLTENS